MTSEPVITVQERYDRGALWAAILVMIGWHLARSLPDALAGWPFSRFAGVSMAVWFGYTALGAVVVMVIVRGRGRGLALPASCSLVLVTGVAVVALSDTSRSYFDRYNWAFYGAGWFALVATWHRPPPDFIVFCAATVTVGAAVLVARGDTDRVSVARFVAITYGFTAIQMTFFVGRRILLSIARDTAEAQNARARVVRQQEAARAVHAARRARYEVVQETAGRLLAELATEIDLSEPETQQRLRVATARLRRLIVETEELPDPLIQKLRAYADVAEQRGVEVDLPSPVGVVPMLSAEVREALAEPVIQVLATARRHARITVVGEPTQVAVAVIADTASPFSRPSSSAQVELSQHQQGGLLWAQTRWTAP